MVVFAERVGGLWWAGAVGMGVGCVIVGMRDEGPEKEEGVERGDGEADGEGVVLLSQEEREGVDVDEDVDEGLKGREGREETEEDLVRF